jgi:hypothetical protein
MVPIVGVGPEEISLLAVFTLLVVPEPPLEILAEAGFFFEPGEEPDAVETSLADEETAAEVAKEVAKEAAEELAAAAAPSECRNS